MQKRPRHVYPSALPARKFAHRPRHKVLKTQFFGKFVYAFFRFRAVNSVKSRPRNEIIPNRKAGVERGILKHHSEFFRDFSHIRSDVFSADFDVAVVLFQKTAHYGNRSRFARAVNAQKREKFAPFNPERKIVYGVNFAEPFFKSVNPYYIVHIFSERYIL